MLPDVQALLRSVHDPVPMRCRKSTWLGMVHCPGHRLSSWEVHPTVLPGSKASSTHLDLAEAPRRRASSPACADLKAASETRHGFGPHHGPVGLWLSWAGLLASACSVRAGIMVRASQRMTPSCLRRLGANPGSYAAAASRSLRARAAEASAAGASNTAAERAADGSSASTSGRHVEGEPRLTFWFRGEPLPQTSTIFQVSSR